MFSLKLYLKAGCRTCFSTQMWRRLRSSGEANPINRYFLQTNS